MAWDDWQHIDWAHTKTAYKELKRVWGPDFSRDFDGLCRDISRHHGDPEFTAVIHDAPSVDYDTLMAAADAHMRPFLKEYFNTTFDNTDDDRMYALMATTLNQAIAAAAKQSLGRDIDPNNPVQVAEAVTDDQFDYRFVGYVLPMAWSAQNVDAMRAFYAQKPYSAHKERLGWDREALNKAFVTEAKRVDDIDDKLEEQITHHNIEQLIHSLGRRG